MKFFAAFILVLFLALPVAHAQENPDDQYVIIYTLIQQGDSYGDSGQSQRALDSYEEAQRELQKFQQVYSDWNPTIVKFRLNYLSERIAALTPQSPSTNVQAQITNAPPAPQDLQTQINSLNAQIHQLQSDNETLQAKLKEALSMQPASVSADEFAQIQQQVRDLAKQNDLLKAAAAQATNAATQELPQLQQALAQQTARANQLAQENQSLQTRTQTYTTDTNSMEALREENALLKQELALGSIPAATNSAIPAPTEDASAELAMAREQISELQADATENWLEKTALENRIKQMQEASVTSTTLGAIAPEQAANPPANQSDLQAHMNELTTERDNLLAQLGEANKLLYGRKNESSSAQIDALVQQVETLRERVEMDEAVTIPYTPQELALFMPQSIAPNANAAKKSLPGASAVLITEAQSYYTNGNFGRAEADYREILRQDKNNPQALGNLASVELEENKIADADQHIQAALAQDPDDPFNLTVLGRVKYSEGKYDESLDALDHAAKMDPQNPEIENFLGVALAQKGLRSQAETAFRKAVQIDPDYGDAHKNLAIIYLSANPPLVELARWHYEKALAAGLPPNLELEKMLNASSASSQQ